MATPTTEIAIIPRPKGSDYDSLLATHKKQKGFICGYVGRQVEHLENVQMFIGTHSSFTVLVLSLCIIQDNPEDVRVQLEVMDKVYRNAVLTIVACHGSDAESGLPGIQPASRSTKQIITEVEGRTLLSYTPDRWRAKRECKWETRGWTYQEKRLSNRLLYVTTHQVYFECKDACEFCEEIAQELNVTPSSNGNPYLRRLYAPNEESFGAYTKIVAQFSTRKVSNPADGLNAVLGILKD
ncbi:hypothetical protein OEA41_010776 [Lepraria neglecta]|uniref:Heterokaryon incompatibility domain-containing protein n=1 Tax=Lepraria neglecta TaxID=209136 RepID=A0AAE0DFK8_9LECA|nr:hypothetical protein OEA41_010776 [Lepraria neglecta]